MHPFRRSLALALLCPVAVAAAPAGGEIRRCMTADGGHVYTDRACADIGATERLPRAAPGHASATRLTRRDCSRSVQDLVFELTAAIDHRDVNRLAGIYHWPGASARGAQSTMARLDAIVNRPLVDISPLHPVPPTATAPVPVAAPGPAREALAWRVAPGAAIAQDPAAATAAPGQDLPGAEQDADLRQPSARRAPVGLVVDQTVADRITPVQTVFSLRRHLGCWWLSL